MTADEVLETMKAYFAGKQPPEVMDRFASTMPTALLTESLDIIDFVVYLDEAFGKEINLTELGGAITNKTFGQLAEEMSVWLETA
jgi:acyl carrier protein